VKIDLIVSYIEENIKKNTTLDDISQYVGISKYHLDRLFKATTKNLLMNYVKNRKLTHSINDLLNTDLKIIDISNEYNFNYEQSYVRSFKRTFKISPGKFRSEHPALEIIDVLNTDFLNPIQESGLIIKPKIKIKPQFSLIGIKHIINSKEDEISYIANKVGNDFFIIIGTKLSTPAI